LCIDHKNLRHALMNITKRRNVLPEAFPPSFAREEQDKLITLGCLEAKGNIREGSSSVMGPSSDLEFLDERQSA
jgi:hypothetical protein